MSSILLRQGWTPAEISFAKKDFDRVVRSHPDCDGEGIVFDPDKGAVPCSCREKHRLHLSWIWARIPSQLWKDFQTHFVGEADVQNFRTWKDQLSGVLRLAGTDQMRLRSTAAAIATDLISRGEEVVYLQGSELPMIADEKHPLASRFWGSGVVIVDSLDTILAVNVYGAISLLSRFAAINGRVVALSGFSEVRAFGPLLEDSLVACVG